MIKMTVVLGVIFKVTELVLTALKKNIIYSLRHSLCNKGLTVTTMRCLSHSRLNFNCFFDSCARLLLVLLLYQSTPGTWKAHHHLLHRDKFMIIYSAQELRPLPSDIPELAVERVSLGVCGGEHTRWPKAVRAIVHTNTLALLLPRQCHPSPVSALLSSSIYCNFSCKYAI